MLDSSIITRMDNVAFFEQTHNSLYKFYEDWEDIADNLLRPRKREVGNALVDSVELVKVIELIYSEAVEETEEGTEIYADKAIKSPKYEQYIENVSKLEKVNL